MPSPRIDYAHRPDDVGDLVLVAHGGQSTSLDDPHDRRPALLRMWPFLVQARRAAPQAAVGLVRYRYRGWNGPDAHAMSDVRAVLDTLPDQFGRVVLVGHSMGGRAVVRNGDHPRVVAVLALAPWLPPDEPLVDLRDRYVVLAHGDRDRMTDPRQTAAYARRLSAAGMPVSLLAVEGETHAMLTRHGDWDELVRRFVGGVVGGQPVDPLLGPTSALDGQPGTLIEEPLPRWSSASGRAGALLSILRARAMLLQSSPA